MSTVFSNKPPRNQRWNTVAKIGLANACIKQLNRIGKAAQFAKRFPSPPAGTRFSPASCPRPAWGSAARPPKSRRKWARAPVVFALRMAGTVKSFPEGREKPVRCHSHAASVRVPSSWTNPSRTRLPGGLYAPDSGTSGPRCLAREVSSVRGAMPADRMRRNGWSQAWNEHPRGVSPAQRAA